MGRRWKRKAKPLIEDSDEEEEEGTVTVAAVAGESGNDDALANANRTLQVAKSFMRRRGVFLNGAAKGTMMKKKKHKRRKKLKIPKDVKVPALIGEENAEAAVNAVLEDPENLELRKLLRGPRYFDPPSGGWATTTCYNCGEEGHMAVNCTAKKKRKPCFVCGSLDHHGMQCAKGLECFICKKTGHRARDCSDKQGGLSEDLEICLKCGETGHDMFSCGNDYNPDDLQEIQCYICKTHGHLCCVNSGNINKTVISCFRCGEWGHGGLVCIRMLENDANSVVHSAHESLFKKKSAHSESPHATKARKRAAKANKKLAESKVSSVQPDESKKKSSPITAPPAIVKTHKRKKSRKDEGTNSTPQKSRGGSITKDSGDTSLSKMKKYNWISPSTPSSKPCEYNSGAQSFQGSEFGYQQQYSGSRFGYSGGKNYSPRQLLGTPGSYGHPTRTYGQSSSTYGPHNTYGQSGSTYGPRKMYHQSGSTYGHRNTYDQSGSTYGHCTYDQPGRMHGDYGHYKAYGPNGIMYGHRNTYGHVGGMHDHHNTYGHSGGMYGDHITNCHSGGAYAYSSSSFDPARTYGDIHGYSSSSYDLARTYGDIHGYPSGSYDLARTYGDIHGYPSGSYDHARTYGDIHGYPSGSYDHARTYGDIDGYPSGSYDHARTYGDIHGDSAVGYD